MAQATLDETKTAPPPRRWRTGTGIQKVGDRWIGETGRGHWESVARLDDENNELLKELLAAANAMPALLSSCLALIDRLEAMERDDGMDQLTVSVVHEAKIATLNAQGIEEEGYNA